MTYYGSDHLVATIDQAEAETARGGRAVSEAATDLDAVARALVGWRGRAGAEAAERVAGLSVAVQTLSGQCLFLADVLRVEGAWLARALLADGASRDERAVEVEDADRRLATRLAEAADALAGFADPATVPCLDLTATADEDPRAVAELWHSLGPAERERLARDHAGLGGVPGLPAAQADALNRTLLARLLDAAPTVADPESRARLAALAAHLTEDPRRHLLALHADGRAVVADADPDRADRVVTLIPGTGSSLATLDQQMRRAEEVCDAAAGADAAAPGATTDAGTDAGTDAATESCVAVTWQGYDAPPDIPTAASSPDRASAHAAELREFAAGLDAVDDLDGHDVPHVAVGYSYGSTVLGASASDPRGLAADRMVHVGSPGAYVESLADQRVDEGGRVRPADDDEVAAVAHRWDPVPWWALTGVLGALPGSEEFGGVSVDVTEPGAGPGSARGAHSSYFDPGTVSLAEIGRLVLGRDEG